MVSLDSGARGSGTGHAVVNLLGSPRRNPFLVKEGAFLFFFRWGEIGLVLVERINSSRTLF